MQVPTALRIRCGALLLAALAGAAIACHSTVAPSGSGASPASQDSRADGALPAAAFFRDPLLSHVTLSPDGEQIAAVFAGDGFSVLMVRPTWGGEVRPLAKLDESGMAIRTLGWGRNDLILVGIDMPHQTAVGARARQSRLLAVDVRGSRRPRYLGEDWPWDEYSQYQDRVIDWLPDDPDHVLINWWQPGQAGASAATVNVGSGALRTVVPAKPWVAGWFADHEGRVRVGEGGRSHGTSWIVYGRASTDDRFEKLVDFDYFDGDGFQFAGFSPDAHRIYVYARANNDRNGVFEYDLERRALGPLVFADREYDVSGLVRSPRTGRLLGVAIERDRPAIHFVDDAARREQAALDRAFPGATTRIVSLDREEKVAIVEVSADVKPPEYYVFDRAQKRVDFLFAAYPDLDSKALASMRPVRYTARDGLAIEGYVTLPPEAQPGQRLPTIVFPHGGPTARDVWGWDATAQFFASRGFAVFQPNFRGSTGYGREHQRKGYRQWGGAMQDDITDGVAWLVAEGIADPDRIGIYGESYGGYAALEALVKTPELFRAGASFAGVADLVAWLEDRDHYLFSDFNDPVHGDSWEDREQLRAVSPARHAERIRAPVLIGHGADDPVVRVEQAHAMADALESAGGEVETYVYPDEVHGFLDERNRIDFYGKVAAFFEKHLAPRPSSAERSS